jgi:N-methylhydantoinase A
MRIGVDTGGTFTDCVLLEGSRIKALKVFTTPDDAVRGIWEGVGRLASAATHPRRARQELEIIHGTTVGTNSLLERRGARVALVTTAGFEDLIEIARQNRPRLYDLNVQREPPLVSRRARWGVRERTAADGKILLRPDPRDLVSLRNAIQRSGAESVALCFLFSFANPSNEVRVARVLRRLKLPVSVSHQILPEFREYERLSTVLINAYLAPRLGEYLARLDRAVARGDGRGRRGRSSTATRLYVMQSSGGVTTAGRAAREPVRTILSGPAGGVVAASWLAAKLGIQRALSFDMGGTSTDVCLLEGPPRTTNEITLAGLPVAVPVLDVHSVGAGGGSLARFDSGGALRVGPESAGALPGPVCYGRGGQRPTVTDANLLLGRLDADFFLGGTFRLDLDNMEKSLDEFLHRDLRAHFPSRPLPSRVALARGIVAVSNATMERALRVISVERGHDPRDFTLIAFGGAGPLHAADLARALGLEGVVVPPNPGAFSALGLLASDIVKDASRSILEAVPRGDIKFRQFYRDLEERFAQLERAARAELRREHGPGLGVRRERRLDIRYTGQAYELSVPFSPSFEGRFHREHEKAYGYAHAGRPLQVVNVRVRLSVRSPKPLLVAERKKASSARSAQVKVKLVWFDDRFWRTPVYSRDRLRAGARLVGPAVIVEYSSTTVVPPDFNCFVDEYSNLRLARHAR